MYIIAENQTVLRPNIITPCPCRSETHRIVRVVGWREAVVEKFVVVIDVGKLERPEHMDTPFAETPGSLQAEKVAPPPELLEEPSWKDHRNQITARTR